MLRAEHFLVDRQRALEELSRSRKLALVLKQAGQIVEAYRRTGMLRAEHFLVDRQRALEELSRSRKLVPGPVSRRARLLRLIVVPGCSGPSTFSRIASDRSESGRAPARSPWSLSSRVR